MSRFREAWLTHRAMLPSARERLKRTSYEKKARLRICASPSASGFPEADFDLGDLLGGNPAGAKILYGTSMANTPGQATKLAPRLLSL